MKWLSCGAVAFLCFLDASAAWAQIPADARQMVDVQGVATHVVTLGLDDREAGEPVLVLMSGAGTPLGSWARWLPSLAELAPVIVYDRPGIGRSEYDGRSVSPDGIADHLDAMLTALDIKPPLVLVGHSWGGVLALYFAGRRSGDVVGMVYLDPKDPRDSQYGYRLVDEEELARQEAVEDSMYAAMNLGAGLLAEIEAIRTFEATPVDERGLPDDPSVPTALVLATMVPDLTGAPEGVTAEWFGRLMSRRLERLPQWVAAMPHGTVIISTDSGHGVYRDAPELSLVAVRRVLKAYRDGLER
jgi:pimeloyl-ACP methyl ester carboxylesterase